MWSRLLDLFVASGWSHLYLIIKDALSFEYKDSCHVYPVAKLGMARHPPCPQKRNISPRHCLNPLRFLILDSETANEAEKSHASLTKTVVQLLGGTANSQH